MMLSWWARKICDAGTRARSPSWRRGPSGGGQIRIESSVSTVADLLRRGQKRANDTLAVTFERPSGSVGSQGESTHLQFMRIELHGASPASTPGAHVNAVTRPKIRDEILEDAAALGGKGFSAHFGQCNGWLVCCQPALRAIFCPSWPADRRTQNGRKRRRRQLRQYAGDSDSIRRVQYRSR
jgi:hypothetical protein